MKSTYHLGDKMSAWKNGDVVYNLGTGTNTIWIRNDNNWLAK